MKKFEKDLNLLVKVSKLYYEDNLTFVEIGKLLKLSRFQIANIIKSAKKAGIVKILIDEKFIDDNIKLSKSFEEYFNIKRAVVVESGKLPEQELRRKIGHIAANFLIDILKDGDVISLTTSSTVNAVADEITNKYKVKNIIIVEANGGSNISYSNSVHEISRKFSKVFNATHYSINAPVIVDSEDSKKILLKEKNIKNSFKLFNNVNILLFGIGTFYPRLNKLMIEAGDLHKDEFLELKSLYASGNILYYYYDIEGNFLNVSFKDRIICLPIKNLENIPCKIAVVYGIEKKYGVLSALKGGLIDFLILDSMLAKEILKIKDFNENNYKKLIDNDKDFNNYLNNIT